MSHLIAVFSDPHIHDYKQFSSGNARLDNCLLAVSRLWELCHRNGIKTILFPGDWYDQMKVLPTLAVNRSVALLYELSQKYPEIVCLAISGNHDMATKNTPQTPAVTALQHLDQVCPTFKLIDNRQFKIDKYDTLVIGIPYYEYPQHFEQALNLAYIKAVEYKAQVASPVILMIHQTPKGIFNEAIPWDTDPTDPLYEPFDLVLCGHIHDHQIVNDKFVVVGSPLHRDLGDVGKDKGYLIFDLHSLDEGFQFVPTKFPQFKRHAMELGEALPQSTDYLVPAYRDTRVTDVEVSSSSDFSADLSPEELITNYWQEADGKNTALLTFGLSLLN
ncbi:SbcD DNA repair exonuclease [uncultured Caudovirales phage]|uniref:SbcD DNA repair exonuclease n=1 Tax=uncultured Caudovirales phage TaxID=2100421 RepID=A0A6J5QWL3_9CAUD|nr:SbcD DNA repair exonuclease [uncultured Caudovirales phage]CAB4193030.1 SbcD DNA repair exonuclease [uncultured Caudovirales phage]CAB4217717.1 SbcD DNA repair exonuclease [uncultured Caudovirales phage]CAB5231535.1 SbcD DNA repair exonuclease [uncultured Caudovirales phage]